MLSKEELKEFLDERVERFNQVSFIEKDPISVPHRYSEQRDVEIAGLFAATFAWGQRKTSINKCLDLLERMDNAPAQFILHHKESDLTMFDGFIHRTFNADDALGFINALKALYTNYDSLEDVLLEGMKESRSLADGISHLHNQFFALGTILDRSKKHLSSPARGSACKRINMYLRWMVRQDDKGVDFGIWKKISPSDLIIPLDVHVIRVASKLGLMPEGTGNWKKAVALTNRLKEFDKEDPVKYDYALFGLGILENFGNK